jgi:hypothetical protein
MGNITLGYTVAQNSFFVEEKKKKRTVEHSLGKTKPLKVV